MSDPSPSELPVELQLAFLPIHKRAFGMAVGTASGLLVFLLTAVYVVRRPDPGFQLSVLSEYFYGYTVSWAGAIVGFAWGFVAGFVAGWFIAFCRNLVLAASLWLTRTRAELAASRDFLDHI
jgi:hypothetical protein